MKFTYDIKFYERLMQDLFNQSGKKSIGAVRLIFITYLFYFSLLQEFLVLTYEPN